MKSQEQGYGIYNESYFKRLEAIDRLRPVISARMYERLRQAAYWHSMSDGYELPHLSLREWLRRSAN